jgi:hypothetical protein
MSTGTAAPSRHRRHRHSHGRLGISASIVAALGLVVCAFGAVEALSLAIRGRTVWFSSSSVADYGAHTHLDDGVVTAVAVGSIVVGAALLLRAVIPPRRRLMDLTVAAPATTAGITRTGLRRTLSTSALDIDGVTAAKVKTTRSRIIVAAATDLRGDAGLDERIRADSSRLMADLALTREPRLLVRLRRKDR